MFDVVIIGSGPAGLSAAIYAKRADFRVLVVEKMYGGTGQVAESSQVDNYLGFVGISGYELGRKFREHAIELGVEFKIGEAKRYEKAESGWTILLKDKEVLNTKTIIYAAGARHRHLGVEGEERLIGKGVSYCATCDGAFFKGKVTVVVGGGNTAMDDALYLSGLCSKVYLVHRRKEFRGAKRTLERIRNKENIEVITEAKVSEIRGEAMVSEVVLESGMKIKTDGVFIAVGMEPQTEEIKGTVALDSYGYVPAEESGKTTAEGFFVAGDVRKKVLRQVVTAVADGANAANSVMEYLRE